MEFGIFNNMWLQLNLRKIPLLVRTKHQVIGQWGVAKHRGSFRASHPGSNLSQEIFSSKIFFTIPLSSRTVLKDLALAKARDFANAVGGEGLSYMHYKKVIGQLKPCKHFYWLRNRTSWRLNKDFMRSRSLRPSWRRRRRSDASFGEGCRRSARRPSARWGERCRSTPRRSWRAFRRFRLARQAPARSGSSWGWWTGSSGRWLSSPGIKKLTSSDL